MTTLTAEYVLNNSVEGLDTVIGQLKDQLRQRRLFNEGDVARVGMALYEALVNAIEHGNLESPSSTREMHEAYYREVLQERSRHAPYRGRRVRLTSILTGSFAKFIVQDEGPGFDPSRLSDPTLPGSVAQTHGRGLYLIRSLMDEVTFNESGNVVTMVKHRAGR